MSTTPTPTGNLATLLNDVGISNTAKINQISDFIGALSDAGGAIGAVASVVEALIGQTQPDVPTMLQQLNNTIQKDFAQLDAAIEAGQIMQRNTDLNVQIADAYGAYSQLQSLIPAKPDISSADLYISQCAKDLKALSGPIQPDNFWNITGAWLKYWSDAGRYFNRCSFGAPSGYSFFDVGYGPQTPVFNAGGISVFYYLGSLQVYLTAVFYILAVGGSLDPNFPQDHVTNITLASQQLQLIHQTIMQGGLTQLSPPNWSQAGLLATACNSTQERSPAGIRLNYAAAPYESYAWSGLLEYGAVEKYSGYSSVGDSYQIDVIKYDTPQGLTQGKTDPNTWYKFQLRLWKRTQDVYAGVGLPAVVKVINQLNAMVGAPPMPSATLNQNGTTVNLDCWSFRQAMSLTNLPPATGGGYSLRALGAFIIGTQPLDTQYSSGATSFSFRSLLTNFSD